MKHLTRARETSRRRRISAATVPDRREPWRRGAAGVAVRLAGPRDPHFGILDCPY